MTKVRLAITSGAFLRFSHGHPVLTEAVREVLRGKPCPTTDGFYRLRSTGLVSGHSARQTAVLRCPLYEKY